MAIFTLSLAQRDLGFYTAKTCSKGKVYPPSCPPRKWNAESIMTTLTGHETTSHRAKTAFAGLDLVLEEGGNAPRELHLQPGKNTVGSSDRCAVCVTDQRARPLHCLIVVEGEEATITRWAPGAVLNGEDFSKAPFGPGDCLEIGEARLSFATPSDTAPTNSASFLEDPQENDGGPSKLPNWPSSTPGTVAAKTEKPSESPPAAKAPKNSTAFKPPSAPAALTAPITIHAATQLESDRLVAELWTANYNARQRCQRLIAAVRDLRRQAHTNEQQLNELQIHLEAAIEEREQLFQQLEDLQSHNAEREKQSAEELDRLIAELSQAYEKTGEIEANLAEQTRLLQAAQEEHARLSQERELWDQQRSAGELQRTKLAQAVADRERSLETLNAELDHLREETQSLKQAAEVQTSELLAKETELAEIKAGREDIEEQLAAALQRSEDAEQVYEESENQLSVLQLEIEKLRLTSNQTEKELESKDATLSNLQAEYRQLIEQRDQLKAKQTQYQLNQQRWEHDLQERQTEIAELTANLESLRSQLAEQEQTVNEHASSCEQYQAEIETLSTERDQLLTAQVDQVQTIQQWEQALADRDRRIRELEEEHEGIYQVLQSVEQGAFEQVDFCNKLENQLANLREERDQLASELPQLKQHSTQLEQTLAQRDGQIIVLNEELSTANQKQADLEADIAAHAQSLLEVQDERKELEARCEAMASEQFSRQQEKVAQDEKLTQQAERIAELERLAEQHHLSQQQWEESNSFGNETQASLRKELEELRTKHEALSLEYATETGRRESLEKELSEGNKDLELYQVDLKSLKSELDRAQQQLAAMTEERDLLRSELEDAKSGTADAVETRVEQGGETDQPEDGQQAQEIAELRQQVEQAKQQANDQLSEMEALLELVDELQEEKTELQKKLEQEELQNQSLAEQLESSATEIDTEASQQRLAELEYERTLLEKRVDEETARVEQLEKELHDSLQSSLSESVELPAEHQKDCLDAPGVQLAETHCAVDYDSEPESYEDSEAYHDAYLDQDQYEPGAYEPTSSESEDWQYEREFTGLEEPSLSEVHENSFTNLETEPIAEFEAEKGEHSTETREEAAQEETLEEFNPVSFIEQYQHMLEEPEASMLQPESAPDEPVARPNKLAEELDAIQHPVEEDSDEALQAYMANMLARMRGDAKSPPPAPEPRQTAPAVKKAPEPSKAVDQIKEPTPPITPQPEYTEPVEPIDLEKLKQTSRKPALPTDLAAMRELANSSARRAIAKHHKRRHLEKAMGLFFVCLVSICVGGYLVLGALEIGAFTSLGFLGGVLMVLVGVAGGFKLLGLLLAAIREGSWEKKGTKTKPNAQPAELPQNPAS